MDGAHHAPTRRIAIGLQALCILGMLTYPLPSAWLGLGGLMILAAARWRYLGTPLPASTLLLPFGLLVLGGTMGLSISSTRELAELRFFGLLAAGSAACLVLDSVRTPLAARCLTTWALIGTALILPVLLVLALRPSSLDRFPVQLATSMDALLSAAEPLRRSAPTDRWTNERFRVSASGLGTLAAVGVGLSLGPLLKGCSRRGRLLSGLALAYFNSFALLSANRGSLLTALVLSLGAILGVLVLRPGSARLRRFVLIGALGSILICGAIVAAGGLRSDSPLRQALRLLPGPARDPESILTRFEYWNNIAFIARDFPITGVGLGQRSVRQVYRMYYLTGEEFDGDATISRRDFQFPHAHNVFLQIFLEQGLPGLLGLIWLLLLDLGLALNMLSRPRDRLADAVTISAACCVLALILSGLFNIVAVTSLGMVLLCGASALLVTTARKRSLEPDRSRRLMPVAHPGLLTGRRAVLGFTAVCALIGIALLIFGTAARSTTLPRPVLSSVAGALYLNLGALELVRATFDDELSHQQQAQHLALAESYLERANELDPNNLGIYRNLAAVALAQSQKSRARKLLARIEADVQPDDYQTLFQVGRLYRELGDVESAVAAWERIGPGMGSRSGAGPRTHLALWGAELVQRGRWEPAITVNRSAIRMDPFNPAPYRSLSRELAQQFGRDSATEEMLAWSQRYPGIRWPYQELAKHAEAAGHELEASHWRERAAAARTEPEWTTLWTLFR